MHPSSASARRCIVVVECIATERHRDRGWVAGHWEAGRLEDLAVAGAGFGSSVALQLIISERLGHSKGGFTLDVYSHLLPGMQEEAAAKTDAGLRAAIKEAGPHGLRLTRISKRLANGCSGECVLIRSEIVLGLPDYEITGLQSSDGGIKISARHTGLRLCPQCGSNRLRNKGRSQRRVRHENWGSRHCILHLQACKFQCLSSAELYDARAGSFSATATMTVDRAQHTATLLPDGTALFAVGHNTTLAAASAEIYDPVKGSF